MSTPVQVQETDSDLDDYDNECPMCMSPLKRKKGDGDGDHTKFERYTVITHCGHRFHLDCLQSTRNFDITVRTG